MICLTPERRSDSACSRPTPSGGSHGAGFMAVMEKMSAASQATIRVAPIPVDEDTAESEPGTAAANSDDRISNESRDDVANGDTHHQDTDDEFLFDLDAKDAFTVDGDDLPKTSLRLVSDATRDPVDIFGPEAVKPTDRLPSSERSPVVLFEPDDRRPTPEGRGQYDTRPLMPRSNRYRRLSPTANSGHPVRCRWRDRTAMARSTRNPNSIECRPEPGSGVRKRTQRTGGSAVGRHRQGSCWRYGNDARLDGRRHGSGCRPCRQAIARCSESPPQRTRPLSRSRDPNRCRRSEPPDNAARPSDTSLRNGAAEHRIFPATASLNPAASPFVRQGGDAARHMADTWLAPATSEMAEPHRATAAAVWGERNGQRLRLQFEAPLAGGILSGLSIRHKDGTLSEPSNGPPQTHLPATFSPPAGLAPSNGALAVAASEASLHLATGSGTRTRGPFDPQPPRPRPRREITERREPPQSRPRRQRRRWQAIRPFPTRHLLQVSLDRTFPNSRHCQLATNSCGSLTRGLPSRTFATVTGRSARCAVATNRAGAEAVRFRGGGSTEITLSPEELGSVRMTLSRTRPDARCDLVNGTAAALLSSCGPSGRIVRDLDLGDTDMLFSGREMAAEEGIVFAPRCGILPRSRRRFGDRRAMAQYVVD